MRLILSVKGTRSRKSTDLSCGHKIIAKVQDTDTHDMSCDWARIKLPVSLLLLQHYSVGAQPKAPPSWPSEVTQYDEIHKSGFEDPIQQVYRQYADRC